MADTGPGGEARLERYRAKRDFTATPEPAGGDGPGGGDPVWVIQKHDARRLHYDLRLEAGGVLVSWAVPKGPSYDPGVKRLAVHVEDHPFAYRSFEGVIPAAQYGSGAVLVWDEGTYLNLTARDGTPVDVAAAVAAGHLSVWLEGTKLRGGWSLTRTHGTSWILVKRHDEHADPSGDVTVDRPDSVRTGRSLADLVAAAADTPAEPAAGDPGGPAAEKPGAAAGGGLGGPAGAEPGAVAAGERGGPAAEKPGAAGPGAGGSPATAAAFVAPMLASVADPDDPAFRAAGVAWRFERKLDGLRCIAVRHDGTVHLWSRNRLFFDRRFPDLVAAVAALPVGDAVLDGEIVAFDGTRTSFSALQRGEGGLRPVFCAFDLLHLLGRDITALPLADRLALLSQALDARPPAAPTATDRPPLVAPVPGLEGDAPTLLAAACADGWEGLVAKRLADPYRSGRSSSWRKLKCTASQELVVGGWTEPGGARTGFGALLVGYYDEGGALRYAGKVGTGFDEATLRRLTAALAGLARADSPFADPVKLKGPHWVEPTLVAAVAFTEWTADGRLRHPSFQGLRSDKAPAEVRRELRRPPTVD